MTEMVGVRFTAAQSRKVRSAARDKGIPLSTWLRVLALEAADGSASSRTADHE